MIVFDENIHQQSLMEMVARWYRGRVVSIRALRPGTHIQDEAISALLGQAKGATFVTTNASDFWRRIPAHTRYCIVCVPLPNEQLHVIPDLLRRLFRLPEFKTKAARMGKVAWVGRRQIRYYAAGDAEIHALAWPA